MGDRALVTFKAGKDYSPSVYLHWMGGDVKDLLKKAQSRLRKGDNTYAAARFAGVCHEQIEGNLGLGIIEAPTKKDTENGFKSYSQGDNGVFVVDVDTGEVVQHSEYADKPLEFTLEMGGDN